MSFNHNIFFEEVVYWSGMLGEIRDNFSLQLTIPKSLCSSLAVPGKNILSHASAFERSILIPSDELLCPKNTIVYFLTSNLVLFSFKPLSLIFKKTFLKRWSCSCNVFPHTTKVSWEYVVPGISEITEVTSLWKTLLAEWIPYGKRLKQHIPEGLPNRSKIELRSSTLICQ